MSYRFSIRQTFVALLLLSGPALAAEPIIGRASVEDGDTVVIHGTRIRLFDIDAPESAQLCQDATGKDYRCGQRAALALADRIVEAPISCEPRDTDRYGRTVAVCRKGAEDLNAWMFQQGYATAYQRYSRDYVPAETAARASKRGVWAGAFDPPSDWRRAKRAGGVETRPAIEKALAATLSPVQAACAIEGNITRNGDKIYHLPGTRDYERTAIDLGSGESMSCTEDEAKAAGWRSPRR